MRGTCGSCIRSYGLIAIVYDIKYFVYYICSAKEFLRIFRLSVDDLLCYDNCIVFPLLYAQDKFSCAGRMHEAMLAVALFEAGAADGNSDMYKAWIIIVGYTG